MSEIEIYLSALFKFLAASLLVERILELADKIFSFFGITAGSKKMLVRLTNSRLPEAQEKNRKYLKMFLMQSTAFIAGIIICYYSDLGIAKEFQIAAGKSAKLWDIFLAGIFISGGSEPIHQLINFLKNHKNNLKGQRIDLESRQTVTEISVSKEKFPKLNISYNGGNDPRTPGHSLRKIDPLYIVIHHSASSENSSFESIVKDQKKERKNAKGPYVLDPSFHSVITYDGKYHNYCRWDSVGWHTAKGKRVSNSNSLGLCFTGNFHKNNIKPSEAQIETGARILALWRILYNIEEANVVPHRIVKTRHTVCPGSNFPFDRLAALSTQLQKEWAKNRSIQKEISKFKKLEYIYV